MARYSHFIVILFLASIGQPAKAQPILAGLASVIDGDTIEIKGQRIRLHGIDAPESRQSCKKGKKSYRCGENATLALSRVIGSSAVQCEQRDIDRYRRIVAVCRVGKINLNRWMVRHGWAVAYRRYSLDYLDEEKLAKSSKSGLWAGRFIAPSRWRRGARLPTVRVKSSERRSCHIKGNISRGKKRIYHLPGGMYYSQTKINELRGERWFCSEEEARANGWRKSRR